MKQILLCMIIIVSLFNTGHSQPTFILHNPNLGSETVSAVAMDWQGRKWCGASASGVWVWGTSWGHYTTSNGLIDDAVHSIAIDAQNNKWIGTVNGVSKFNGSTWTNYTTTNGLIANNITDILIDYQGNKWFSTPRGISKFNGTTWTNYNELNGLPDSTVNSIYEDGQHNIWAATNNGVGKFNGTTWTSYYPMTNFWGTSIAVNAQGTVFVGGMVGNSGFLMKYNGSTWTTINSTTCGQFITDIVPDNLGNIWVSTFGFDGLLKYDGTTITQYNYATLPGWPTASIFQIAIDPQNTKWVGTSYNGVIEFIDDASGVKESDLISKISLDPNPVSLVTNFSFTLKEEITATISIIDLSGKMIAIVADEKMDAGEHKILIDTEKIAAGLYYLVLCTDQGVNAQKLSVVK